VLHIVAQRFPFPPRRGDQLAVSKMILFCQSRGIDYRLWVPPTRENKKRVDESEFKGNCGELTVSFVQFIRLLIVNPLMPFQSRLFSFFVIPDSSVAASDIIYVHTVRMIGSSYFLRNKKHLGAQIDLSAEFVERASAAVFPISWWYLVEAWLLSRQKRALFPAFLSVFRVTENEFVDLENSQRKRVNLVTNAHGFDAKRIRGKPVKLRSKRLKVGFWGNMKFTPNKLAVDDLLKWHRSSTLDHDLLIFGVDSLGLNLPKSVICLGEVDDIDQAIRDVDVLVNLVSVGAGFQNKTIEAWAQNIPVVGYRQAFRGLPNVGKLPILVQKPEDVNVAIKKLWRAPVEGKYSDWVRENWNQDKLIREKLSTMGYE
jgi:hypothetical protein